MPRPISRAELARTKGVSGAAITKACKTKLADACLPGGRIDLDHPAVQAYLGSAVAIDAPTPPEQPSKTKPELRAARARQPRREQPTPAAPSAGADEKPLEELTVREVAERFGTTQAFKDYLDALKKVVDIREKDLKNDETEGRLIERELVKTHVFGAIEAANRRLLTDAPKTVSRRIYALAKSGATLEEAEKTVREILSSTIAPVKATASRVLRNA